MGSLIERKKKLMMMQGTSVRPKYWLSGQDAPVLDNGSYYWVDRASCLRWKLYGTDVYDSANNMYVFFSNDNYAELEGGPNDSNFSFGHHWRFTCDADFVKRDSGVNMIIDIGSYGSAQKAMSFGMSNIEFNWFINWKMQGNNSNPFANQSQPHPGATFDNIEVWERKKIDLQMLDGGDGYDRLTAIVNGISVTYDDIKVPQVTYGPTWQSSYLSAYIARGAMNKNSHLRVRIRDLKIYELD